MIIDLITRFLNGCNFTRKDFISLIIIICFALAVFQIYQLTMNTNLIIHDAEQRYFEDIEENALAVLNTLQKKNIYEIVDIAEFLAPKPAGRSNLKKGVLHEEIYPRLLKIYGNLAKNAKIALTN